MSLHRSQWSSGFARCIQRCGTSRHGRDSRTAGLLLTHQRRRSDHVRTASSAQRHLLSDLDVRRGGWQDTTAAQVITRAGGDLQTGDIAAVLRRDTLSDWDKTKIIAHRRRLSHPAHRANSYEQILDFLPSEEREQAQSSIDQLFASKPQPEWRFAVWTAWVNILAHCRDWDEALEELRRASSMRPSRSDEDAFVNRDLWPARILDYCIGLVRSPAQAIEAIHVFKHRLPQLSLRDAITAFSSLSGKVHVELQATNLGHLTTEMAIRIAQRCVQRQAESSDDAATGPSAYAVLERQLYRLMKRRDTPSQDEAMRLLHWANRWLDVDHADRLQLQVLQIHSQNKENRQKTKAWDEVTWTRIKGNRKPFVSASMATDILDRLYRNGRNGGAFTLALRHAMYVATQEVNKKRGSDLVRRIQAYLEDRDGLHVDSLPSTELFRLLISHGKEHEAWNVLHHLLDDTKGGFSVQHWALVIGWAARTKSIAVTSVLRLAGISEERAEDVLQISGSAQPPSTVPNETPLNGQLLVLSTLMNNLVRRRTVEGFNGTLYVWRHMQRNKISPDGRCLAYYCRALMYLQRSQEAYRLLQVHADIPVALNAHPLEVEECTPIRFRVEPDRTMMHLIMMTMLDFGRRRAVYDLFRFMDAHPGIKPNGRTLELLLQAAIDATNALNDLGGASSLLPTFFSRFGRQTSQWKQVKDDCTWDGRWAAAVARESAQLVMFEQHPELQRIGTPLESSDEGYFSRWTRPKEGKHLEESKEVMEWLDTLTDEHDSKDGRWKDISLPSEPELRSARASSLHLTPQFFHRYMLLLRYSRNGQSSGIGDTPTITPTLDDGVLVMAWMRALRIRPLHDTLCLLCTFLDDRITPTADFFRRGQKHAETGDADDEREHRKQNWATGPMSQYLADWLGEDALPTNEEVLRFIRRAPLAVQR